MNIHLDRHSTISLSRQIQLAISDRIRSGLLEKGSQLPSVRKLSTMIGVSLITTVKAYHYLEEEGLVEQIQGKGSFVKSSEKYKTAAEQQSMDWQLSVKDYLPRAQFWNQLRLFSDQSSVSLSVAALNPTILPIKELTTGLSSIINHETESLSVYGSAEGDLNFRIAASTYFKKRGLSISAQNLLVTNGAQQGIDLVARTFVGPGDVVMMEAPTYAGAVDVFRGRGATIISIPVDKEGLRTDLLLKLCDTYTPKLIYVNPTFQNPTGTIMSSQRRKNLLDIVQSYQSILVEDDSWSEINFSQIKATPIKNMDTNGNVIYIKSFSKFICPGCRIGLLAANGTFLNRLTAAKANADMGSPLLTQKAVGAFLTSPKLDSYLKKLTVTLRKRRDDMLHWLDQYAPEGITWTVPDGGVSLWVTFPTYVNTDQLLIEAQKEHLSFLPGSIFYPTEPEYHHLRLSFSYLEEHLQQKTMKQFGEFLRKHLKKNVVSGHIPTF